MVDRGDFLARKREEAKSLVFWGGGGRACNGVHGQVTAPLCRLPDSTITLQSAVPGLALAVACLGDANYYYDDVATAMLDVLETFLSETPACTGRR